MEEIKNNAVEKVENTEKKVENKKKVPSKKSVAKNAKKSTTKGSQNSKKKKPIESKKQSKKQAKEKIKEEKRQKALQKKAEKEKIRAEKRIELAKIKADKKAQKQKAKLSELREKKKKQAEKEALKAKKAERKEMLKKETKSQKQKRIREEKAERARIKKEKQQQKANLKKQKLEEKRIKREQKNAGKKSKRDSKQKTKREKRGFGGWLAAVISLGSVALALAVALSMMMFMPRQTDTMLSTTYERAFYDTVSCVDNIDLNLSKVLATTDTGATQKYLVDLAIASELAENDIQELPLHDENKFYTTKLINQIGDYAKYLNNKLIDGESITAQEKETLVQLYNANLELKESLASTINSMGKNFDFSSMEKNGNNVVTRKFNELQNLSIEYPELIYDGPFSDGQLNREVKGLTGEEVSKEKAKENFISIFGDYGLSEIEEVGETTGMYETYNFTAKSQDKQLYAQMTKKGGRLIMFNFFSDCNEINYDRDQTVEIAERFLEKAGFENMKAVWVNETKAVAEINFAYYQDGVVVYPDLVKVNVCQESGMVIGLEASSYYLNHTKRNIPNVEIRVEEALEKISTDIDVETSRLAIVPLGASSETIAYEFVGDMDGTTYYVYIDAINGRQVQMFKVIESTEGTLLL